MRWLSIIMYRQVEKYLPRIHLRNQNMQSQSISPLSWSSDLDTSGSHGYGDFSSFGSSSCFSIDICPDLVLGAIAAASAAAGFLIYTAIINAAARRKKRDDNTFISFLLESSIGEVLKTLGKSFTEYCKLKIKFFFSYKYNKKI